MVKINGKNADVAGKTIEEYIESAGYQKSRIVVELNQTVLPKAEYECTRIKDGDVIEIVGFVGGG